MFRPVHPTKSTVAPFWLLVPSVPCSGTSQFADIPELRHMALRGRGYRLHLAFDRAHFHTEQRVPSTSTGSPYFAKIDGFEDENQDKG